VTAEKPRAGYGVTTFARAIHALPHGRFQWEYRNRQ